MSPRTLRTSLVLAALVAGCSGKKASPGAGSAPTEPPPPGPIAAGGADAQVAPPPPPPPPLPPLAADPGGATGAVQSLTPFGGPGTETPRAVVAVADGAIVSGDFEGTAAFGATSATSVGKADAMVLRVGADGKPTWVTTFGGANDDTADVLAVGTDGTIAVGGLFSDKLTAGAMHATSNGSDDMYVAGLGPDGAVRWLWTTGGPGSDATTALAATPDGGFIVGVSWFGVAKFGDAELVVKGYDDAALVKLSATGAVEWVTPVTGDGSESIKHIAVDANGTIYVLGTFQMTLDAGGGPLTSAGAFDLLIAAFDSTGHHRWSQRIGNPWNEVAGGIAVDRAGELTITGSFDRDLDFLGTPLVAAGESDVVVARFASDGKLRWVKRFGNDREDIGYGVAVDDAGNAVITGWYETPIDFGGGPLKGKGQKDGFIAKLGPDGRHLWSKRFGDWANDSGNAVAVAADGSIWLTGMFRYTLDLTSPTQTSTMVPGSKLQRADGFIAHLAR